MGAIQRTRGTSEQRPPIKGVAGVLTNRPHRPNE